MDDLPAKQAIRYATSKELFVLYAGFVIVWLLSMVERVAVGVVPRTVPILNEILSMLLTVATVGVFLITVVAILYKVLSDST